MERSWCDVKDEIARAANLHELVPFLGAAVSSYSPSSLPQGDGMIRATLAGVFQPIGLFKHALSGGPGSAEEEGILLRSPEVVLQGLFEGLPERMQKESPYHRLAAAPHNRLHELMAEALRRELVPAVMTTNPDPCIEAAAEEAFDVAYDEEGFEKGLRRALFQFHGAVATGSVRDERRRRSLTNTLRSMGDRLPESKGAVLGRAVDSHTVVFLGYSGGDPDVWYTLDRLLAGHGASPRAPSPRPVYWCVRPGNWREECPHLARLHDRPGDHVIVFEADMLDVFETMAGAWGCPLAPGHSPRDHGEEERCREALSGWSSDVPDPLTGPELELAYGWLLLTVGQHREGVAYLEYLTDTAHKPEVRMRASLLSGHARREMADHRDARRHLKKARRRGKDLKDQAIQAHALSRFAESLGAFESFRFWHFFLNVPLLAHGTRGLRQALSEFDRMPEEERDRTQLSRSGPGTTLMYQGMLHRRVAHYWSDGIGWPRPGLHQSALRLLRQARRKLEEEGDMRALSLCVGGIASEDENLTPEERRRELLYALELATFWNQDDIQRGSALFALAQDFAPTDPGQACQTYRDALAAFKAADEMADVARTRFELAKLLSREPAYARHPGEAECQFRAAKLVARRTQGSWEWRLVQRLLTWLSMRRDRT